MDIPYDVTKKINKSIPDGIPIAESLQISTELKMFQKQYPQLFEYAVRLEGLERNTTTHAGGVVITPKDKTLSDFCSIQYSKEDEEITQYEMDNCEEIGLVKMDFLGLSTLDVIYDTYDLIKQTKGIEIELHPDKVDFNDQPTYDMLEKGLTKGVFQLGSTGITEVCKRMKPHDFDELTNLISFYRPATMAALERYLQKKEGKLEYTATHPVIANVLDVTKGELAYQEQMMRLMKDMAGFSDAEADRARKVSSKKKEDEFHEYMEKFKIQSLANGFKEEEVQSVYDMIKDSASYSFALAHGVSYAMLTYFTAYLKCHYPTEFMCALLTNQRKEGSLDNVALNEYLKECERLGVKVSSPNVNKSQMEFSITGEMEISFGLGLIKSCDKRSLNAVIKNRPYKSLQEVIQVTTSKTTLLALIKCGAMDSFGDRQDMLIELLQYRFENGMESKGIPKSVNKKSCQTLLDEGLIQRADIPEFGRTFKKSEQELKEENDRKKEKCLEKLAYLNKKTVWEEWKEKYLNGDPALWEYIYLSYALTGELFPEFKSIDYDSIEVGLELDLACLVVDIDKKKVKRGKSAGKEMAILSLDTPYGEVRAVVFAHSWEYLKHVIVKEKRLVLTGEKKADQYVVTGGMDYSEYVRRYMND